MKILQIHNTYQQRGGEDVVLTAEFDLLRQHGHQVEQLVFSNDDITGVAGKLRTSLSSFYNPASARRLRERIEAYRPDVIHVHNFLYVASPAVFYAARQYNVPVVLTLHSYRLICAGFYLLRDGQVCELCVQHKFPIHGVVHACFKNSRLQSANYTLLTGVHKWLNTWTRKVDVLITLTPFSRNKLVHSSLRPDPARVVVKANSVPDYGVGTEPREDYFLFVGRLSPEKGISTLLESLEHASFRLVVIGGGDLEDQVKQAAARHPNLTYLGFQEKDVIIRHLRKCRGLLFPSLWYEGLPNTILEAYATGTPVVATDVGNLNEIVRNGVTGVLFEKGDARSLARQVAALQSPDCDWPALSRNARSEYLAQYAPEKNYQALIGIYQTVTALRHPHYENQ